MESPDHPFHSPRRQIPRFLFRGFNKYSGGGIPGQNTTEGICPLAFLQEHDEEMEVGSDMDPDVVIDRVIGHCCQRTDAPLTPFSSWSHDWRTALAFACSRLSEDRGTRHRLDEDHGSHIAVLDTWALGDEETLRKRIFHVPEFKIPGINYPCEWLIWGPVSDPAYRCVSVSKIRETINCRVWPHHILPRKPEASLLLIDVHDSLAVAGLFQRQEDTDADVMFAVAAAEMACRLWGCPSRIGGDGDPDTDEYLVWPREVLEEVVDAFKLCNPVLSDRPLVHGSTALVGFPRVQLMYTLLRGVQARWRDDNLNKPWTPVDWEKVWRERLHWRETTCRFCAMRSIGHEERN